MDVAAASTQSPVFQLQVYRLVVADLASNSLDVAIAEFAHPAMGAAQQKLVQIEHGHVKNIAELPLQIPGVGGDATQFIIGRDECKPDAAVAAGPPQWRCPGRSSRQNGGLGFELQRRHIWFLHRRPLPVLDLVKMSGTQVLSRGMDRTAADRPKGESNRENRTERSPSARIQGLFGQRRLDKAGKVNLLAVGIHA